MAVKTEEVITLGQVGALAISLAQDLDADPAGGTTGDVADAYRLIGALALATKRLADARRDDLEEVVARARREVLGGDRSPRESVVDFAGRVAARFETRAGKLGTAQADEAHTYRVCARMLREEVGL